MAEFGTNLLDQQFALIEAALSPGGVLNDIAHANIILEESTVLTVEEAAEALLPDRASGAIKPRWEIVQESGFKQRLIADRAYDVLALAVATDIRRIGADSSEPETFTEEDIARLKAMDEFTAVAEPGANGTFAVRPFILREGLRRAGKQGTEIFQPTSPGENGRAIAELRADGSANPERMTVGNLAPSLPKGDTNDRLVTHAINQQLGYELATRAQTKGVGVATTYERGAEKRTVIEPQIGGVHRKLLGFRDGLTAIDAHLQETQGRELETGSLVIGTNGQYRMGKALLGVLWAAENGRAEDAPLILGDEAGFEVPHLDNRLVTGDRAAHIYVPEFVATWRIGRQIRAERVRREREARG